MRTLLCVVGGLVALVGCVDPACDPAGLQGALDEAAAGDVVEVGDCTVVADLEVPSGVVLRGGGAGVSIVEAESAVALRVAASDGETTRIEGLTVRSDACAGLVATGDGAVEVAGVAVEVTRGIGIGAEGLRALALIDVAVSGPILPGVSPAAIPLPPYTCDTADPATHGIVVVEVAGARLEDVTSRGFAAFGALAVESTTTWNGGTSADHIGVALEVYGGSAELTDVELVGARQDVAPTESFGAVFAGGATVSSTRLTVRDGEVFGVFHAGAAGTHVDLVAEDNGFAGVWSQDAASLALSGTGTSLRGNGFAGVAAFRVDAVSLADATIEGTVEGLATTGPTGAVRGADGLHLVDSPDATLERLALLDNGRIGMLADLGGGSTTAMTIADVRVRGTGAELGAVAQNGTVDPGWDAAIVREGDTASNDAMVTAPLDIAGAVGPLCFPDVTGVATAGLGALVP